MNILPLDALGDHQDVRLHIVFAFVMTVILVTDSINGKGTLRYIIVTEHCEQVQSIKR